MTSFFSSTFRALSVCDIFVFESCQKFIFNAPIPPPPPHPFLCGPLWSVQCQS